MKKEEKTQARRERIIQAALCEFGEKGYRGFVINDLCKNHDISKGILYHNFADKKELYLACVRRSFQKAVSYMMKEEGDIPDLQTYMLNRQSFFIDCPQHGRVFFEAWVCPPREALAEVEKEKEPFLALNRSVCQKLLSTSRLKEGISPELGMEYLLFMQDMFRTYFYAKSDSRKSIEDSRREYEESLNRVVHGMLYGIIEKEEKRE